MARVSYALYREVTGQSGKTLPVGKVVCSLEHDPALTTSELINAIRNGHAQVVEDEQPATVADDEDTGG